MSIGSAHGEVATRGPSVRDGWLHGATTGPVAVGSPEWCRVLDGATAPAIRVEDTEPPFTARRERRGSAGYWYAYRRSGGTLRKAYLGRGRDLDAEALHAAADELGGVGATAAPLPRRTAVAQVRSLLRTSRLVTLVGPGGIGKSCLAAEVATAGPGWTVELAPVSDGRFVGELARAGLGLLAQPGRRPAETIALTLGRARRLLVVDNCEHLRDAAVAFVAELLIACPGVVVLATSRQPLGSTGECVWQVPSLRVPEPGAHAGAVLATEAGKLLRARARAACPGFAITDSCAPAAAAVCRAVDGIPLAVELAASALAVLSVDELATRLHDVLDTLDGPARGRSGRMRAVLDWSHARLGERDRVLFARLSVFAASWDLAAAEDVATGGSLARADVADGLAVLARFGLVVAVPGTERRFRMLEPLRQYAAQRLVERGEEDAVRDRLAAHMVAITDRIDVSGPYRRQPPAWMQLIAEPADLWAAWQWLVTRGDLAAAGRLAATTSMTWMNTIGTVEAGRRLSGLLEAIDEIGVPDGVLARVLVAAASVAGNDGDLDSGFPLAERAVSVCRRAGDRELEPLALFCLQNFLWWRRDLERAWTLAVEVAHTTEGRGGIEGAMLAIQALVGVATGRPAAAAIADRALAVSRAADAPGPATLAAAAVALVAHRGGEHARARAIAADGAAEPQAALAGRLLCQIYGCWTELADGRLDAARALADAALDRAWTRMGPSRLCLPLELFAQLAAALGEPERAVRLLGAVQRLREDVGLAPASYEREQLERWTGPAAVGLGPDRADAELAAGRLLDPADAVALARATGSGSPPRPRERMAPLTARQSEVARLVADGLSNAAIAAALHLATSTVERHLANAYLALGVRTRTQLAGWVTARRPPPAPG